MYYYHMLLPDKILDVNYDFVTKRPTQYVTGLLSALALPWEERAFNQN